MSTTIISFRTWQIWTSNPLLVLFSVRKENKNKLAKSQIVTKIEPVFGFTDQKTNKSTNECMRFFFLNLASDE